MFLLLSCPVGRGCVRCAGSGLVQSLTAITNLRPERWKRSQTAQKASPLWTNGSVVVLIPNQYNQYPSCKEVPWIVVVIGESVDWISPVQVKYYHSKTNPCTNRRLWMTLRSCVFFRIFCLSEQKCERLLLLLFCSDLSVDFHRPLDPAVSPPSRDANWQRSPGWTSQTFNSDPSVVAVALDPCFSVNTETLRRKHDFSFYY